LPIVALVTLLLNINLALIGLPFAYIYLWQSLPAMLDS
jgi:hypothetical protein